MSEQLTEITPEYVYVTIPAEYICVYHRILAMLADYGEAMLKDCKAACTDRQSGVIECFNMFNAAVAARKLGKTKLAELLIKYIKSKINQIYRGVDNSPQSFVFPIDEDGNLKAFVTCGDSPTFKINPDDMELYEKFEEDISDDFTLGNEDKSEDEDEANTEDNEEQQVNYSPRVQNGVLTLPPNTNITATGVLSFNDNVKFNVNKNGIATFN